MSGFEIAGLVLGALPIVIEALAEYRAAKGFLATVRKFRGLLDDLIHQLKTHKTNFYLDILQLLREVRVREILDDGDPTEDDLDAIIRAIHVQKEDQTSETQREWEAQEASKESKNLAKAFAYVQVSALSLCRAVSQWWNCDYHTLHTTMIRLENRIVDRRQTTWPTHVIFRLCLPIEESPLQEVEVRARVKYQQALPEHTSGLPLIKDDEKVPAITVTTTYCEVSQPTNTLVMNMCETARKSCQLGHIISLELIADILDQMEETILPKRLFKTTMTLADYLAATENDPNARLSLKQQTLLALDIATAVLQLRHTSWCSVPWNSKTIKFLVEGNGSLPTFAPYVDQSNTQVVLNDPKLRTQIKKATVLEIGILLLEILHHKSIETWATENNQESTVTFWE